MQRILTVVVSIYIACIASQVARAQALLNQVTWEELPQHLIMESVPLLELPLCDCPPSLDLLRHVRTTAQYIENTFYVWDEYEVPSEVVEGQRCVMMKRPHHRPLTSEEARTLLTASSLWSIRRQSTSISRQADSSVDFFSIIGTDDRSRVPDTQIWPWNTYCFLRIEYSEIGTYRGTGFIVGPHLVLTCAHMTYDKAMGLRPDSITIIPARNGKDMPFGSIEAIDSSFDPRYPTSIYPHQDSYECGAVFFDAGDQLTGIHTYAPITFSTELRTGDPIAVAGYPQYAQDLYETALWDCSGKVIGMEGHTVRFDADATEGQSGSPLRSDTGDIVGIFYMSAGEENWAVTLDSHNAQMIQQWMQWTPSDAPVSPSCPLEAPALVNGGVFTGIPGGGVSNLPASWESPAQQAGWSARASDLPATIEAGASVWSSLYIPYDCPLTDLRICLDVEHSQLSSVNATLFAPDGTRIRLLDSGDAGTETDLSRYLLAFTDAASNRVPYPRTDSGVCSLRPCDPLAVMNDKEPYGTWILHIEDTRESAGLLETDDIVRSWEVSGSSRGSVAYLLQCAVDPAFVDVYCEDNILWKASDTWGFASWIWNHALDWGELQPFPIRTWYRVKAQLIETWIQTTREEFEIGYLDGTVATNAGEVILRQESPATFVAQADETAVTSVFGLDLTSPFALYGRYGGMVLVKCERPVLLTQAMAYLDAASGISVQFLVYESETEGGPYKRLYLGPPQTYAAIQESCLSQQINVFMRPGNFYSVGIASEDEMAIQSCWIRGGISFGEVVGGALSEIVTVAKDGAKEPALYHPSQNLLLLYPRFTLFTKPAQFVLAGTVESPAIDLTELPGDCIVYFDATTPEGTELKIDLVDAARPEHIIKPNITGLDELGNHGRILNDADVRVRLRATMTSADPNVTPVLRSWSISHRQPTCESPWSNIVMERTPAYASDPSPEDGAIGVPVDTVLSWAPGDSAMAHDVYFGFAEYSLSLVSQQQTGTTYKPGDLDFDRTYYWQVVEVGPFMDGNARFRGDVWSFTTEPYPCQDILATSNGVSDENYGPENTVNGSGMDVRHQHSMDPLDMWLARPRDNDPLWIQYEFDAAYRLEEMRVWNYNTLWEPLLGYGLKDVTVLYSMDGTAWTRLGQFEFAQGTARSTYTANTTVDFGGVPAKYVRLTVHSNWSGFPVAYGLSEVRFAYTPVDPLEP